MRNFTYIIIIIIIIIIDTLLYSAQCPEAFRCLTMRIKNKIK